MTSTQTTVRFLSPDYLTELANLPRVNRPPILHVNVVVQFHATDTPDDTVDYYLRVERGLIVAAGQGTVADNDVAITATYQDLVAFQSGDLHAAMAFVTGQFAVTGDKAKLLDLVIVLQSGQYHQFVAALWEKTTW
jgi:predicted lipid carrier protein YhbT